jgi:hypothetical protein
MLSNIFLYDYMINKRSTTRSPQRVDFLRQILPQLDPLKDAQMDQGDSTGGSRGGSGPDDSSVDVPSARGEQPMTGVETTPSALETTKEEEEKRIIRLCKTGQTFLHTFYPIRRCRLHAHLVTFSIIHRSLSPKL